MNGRNEWKYLLSVNETQKLKSLISSLIDHDEHSENDGGYIIHSLYFDDDEYSCAFDTEYGLSYRYKWRIRFYNNNPSVMKLEKKIKRNGVCYKKMTALSMEDYYRLVSGEIDDLLYSEDALIREFALQILLKSFKPSVIVDYYREAYVEKITNTRITFDKCITVSRDFDNFLQGTKLNYPVIEDGNSVLEVKFDNILPNYIRRACEKITLNQISFSKYHLGFELLTKGEKYEFIRNA